MDLRRICWTTCEKSCEPSRDHLRLRKLRDYSFSRSRNKQSSTHSIASRSNTLAV
ncbi:hypothetical protein BDV37DRAFT_237226, partial [Aspergillus pseudonomiae]